MCGVKFHLQKFHPLCFAICCGKEEISWAVMFSIAALALRIFVLHYYHAILIAGVVLVVQYVFIKV